MSIQALPGSRLSLWTETGSLPARAGILPQHLDRKLAPEIGDIYIDIGAASAEEARGMGVNVGDVLTWEAPLERLGAGRITAKSLDDRLGVWTLLTLAQEMDGVQAACDLWLVFIVREEIMLNSAAPFIDTIKPEVLIGIDGTLTFDTPDLENGQCEVRLAAARR